MDDNLCPANSSTTPVETFFQGLFDQVPLTNKSLMTAVSESRPGEFGSELMAPMVDQHPGERAGSLRTGGSQHPSAS